MTSRAAPRDDAQACVRAYEALRSHVLAGANTASHAGLIVLLRQGVAAWMMARRSVCTCPAPAAPRTTTLLVGEEIHAAIVRVWASMALAAQPEGHL